MKLIIIDNYDSFTFNLYQYLAEYSETKPEVFANDMISYQTIKSKKPDAIVISPGPGNPNNNQDFGVSREILERTKIPTLGVCLGHQGIAVISGGEIIQTKQIMHGQSSKIYHTGKELFHNIPQGFTGIRYHSLAIDPDSLPRTLQKTAWTNDGIIMGIRHIERPLWGVQFHPESIGTRYGKDILKNFLQMANPYEK